MEIFRKLPSWRDAMRGRLPVGPEYVDKLQGSSVAKERAKAVLETLTGELRLQEACERLEVCEQRLHQLRQQALQAAVTALEPGLPGRPAQAPADEQVRLLQEQVAALQRELWAAKAREEIALILPGVTPAGAALDDGIDVAAKAASAPEKKRQRRRHQQPRPPPPGPRTNT